MNILGTLLLLLLLAYVNVVRMQECGRVINANLDRIQVQGPPGKAGLAAEIDYQKITQILAGVMKAEMASFRDEVTAEKVALRLEIEKIRLESNEKFETMSEELKARNADNAALRLEMEKIRLESNRKSELMSEELKGMISKLAKCANKEKCIGTEETAILTSSTPLVVKETPTTAIHAPSDLQPTTMYEGTTLEQQTTSTTGADQQYFATAADRYYHIEVLFVLDGSGSMGENFEKVKDWVKLVTSKLNIDAGNVTVGVVQYSHYMDGDDLDKQPFIVTEIKIGQYTTYESFALGVDKIRLQGFTTYTGYALRKVALDFARTENYGKVWNKQVMFLVTDGMASDYGIVAESAGHLRDMGVITYAVGIAGFDIKQLRLIANGNVNDNTRVYGLQRFHDLTKIVASVERELKSIGSQAIP